MTELTLIAAALLILALELLIQRQEIDHRRRACLIRKLNKALLTLRDLSYLLSSRRSALKDDIDEFVAAFLLPSQFTDFRLLVTEPKSGAVNRIFRYNRESRREGEPSRKSQLAVEPPPDFLNFRQDTLPDPWERDCLNCLAENEGLRLIESAASLLSPKTLPEGRTFQLALIPISFGKMKLGYIFLSSRDKIVPEAATIQFLKIGGGLMTLVLKKFYLNDRIPLTEQLKAASSAW